LKKIIRLTTTIEKENLKIWGMSTLLENLPFRVIIRPLGISLLKEDSNIGSLNSIVNDIVVSLSNTKPESLSL
jgi:hypothetical protein